jgi:hypothetical protein
MAGHNQWPGQPGLDFGYGQEFFFGTTCGPILIYLTFTGRTFRELRVWSLKITIHLQLVVPRLRISETPVPHVFMA